LEGNRTGRDEVRPDFVSRRQQSSQDSSCLFFHRREHLHKLLRLRLDALYFLNHSILKLKYFYARA
jgi:hypothetical protein